MVDSINNTLKVKETQMQTTRYYVTCPACGDDDYETDFSCAGEVFECPCGARLEIE